MDESRDDIVVRLALERGYLSEAQITEARQAQRFASEELGLNETFADICVSKGLLSADRAHDLVEQVAVQTGEARIIGNYELVAKIGAGGMGAVYEAACLDTGEHVALKILPPSMATTGMIARFQRESAIAARLQHDNIVRCLEFGRDARKGVWFCALELVDGEDLERRMERHAVLSETDTAAIARQVAQALQHAYFNGLVHRDVKPSNVMVTPDGTAKLLDLGLARHAGAEASRLTLSGQFVGSPHYASPEQATGEADIDIRSDIYSLGATMYHMATGTPPFSGTSTEHLLFQHVHERLTWPGDINQALSGDFCRVIAKMMAKSREDRYQSPKDLLRDLDLLAEGLPVEVDEAVLVRSSVGVSSSATGARKRPASTRTRPARDSGRLRRVEETGAPERAERRPVREAAAVAIPASTKTAVGAGAAGLVLVSALALVVVGSGDDARGRRLVPPPPPVAVTRRPFVSRGRGEDEQLRVLSIDDRPFTSASAAAAAPSGAAVTPAAVGAPVVTEDFIWLEGEAPVTSTFTQHIWYHRANINTEILSGHDWISNFRGGAAPQASYELDVARTGDYVLWLRATPGFGVEISARVDGGDWRSVPRNGRWSFADQVECLTLGTQPKDPRSLAWAAAGTFPLMRGRHMLEIRISGGLEGDKGKNGGGIDCMCLARSPQWRPMGQLKPTDGPPPRRRE